MFVPDIQSTVRDQVGIDQSDFPFKLSVVNFFLSYLTKMLVDELIA